jgi:hypothetical protein
MAQPWKKVKHVPKYFIFTEDELLKLIVCLVLDISEYVAVILLMPVTGDLLDLVGIIASFVMFSWLGLISLVELVPGADVFPTFTTVWLIWYFIKTRKKNHG